MFKQKAFFVFVLCTTLLGGFGSFFIYDLLFTNSILAIIIGVAVAIFIALMEAFFVISMLDEIKYQKQRNLMMQVSLQESRRKWWQRYRFTKWITQVITRGSRDAIAKKR